MIDLGEYQLYPISNIEKQDIKFLKEIKDKEARRFNLKNIIRRDLKETPPAGESYLVKEGDTNVGYAYVSDIKNTGEVVVTLAIHQKRRGNQAGRRLIESLSGYVLGMDLVNGVIGYVDTKNEACKKVLLYAGFKKIGATEHKEIYRKGK